MVSKAPGVRASEHGKYQMWFTQGLGAPGGESLISQPAPPQVGRQRWAIPGLSYTAETPIPEVTWAPASLLPNQLRLQKCCLEAQ